MRTLRILYFNIIGLYVSVRNNPETNKKPAFSRINKEFYLSNKTSGVENRRKIITCLLANKEVVYVLSCAKMIDFIRQR